ncbi:MAG: hypothetical protein E6H68_15735 [Betaproteobacteria bacterium]|nr:MAG: hypothetical protein E6H68_15735 [Betaproteobacteria bacterium]
MSNSSCTVMIRAVVDGVAREPTWVSVSPVVVPPFFVIASQTIAVSGFLAGSSTTVQIQFLLIGFAGDQCTVSAGNPTLVTTVINH